MEYLTNNLTPHRQVRILTIGLSIIYVANLIMNWDLIQFTLVDGDKWDLSTVEFLVPKVVLLIGLVGLFLNKKYGWIITTAIYTYFTVSTFIGILIEIKWLLNEPDFGLNTTNSGPLQTQQINKETIDLVFGRRPIYFYVGQFVIPGAILLYLNSTTIIDFFKIHNKVRLQTLGLVGIPTLILGLSFLLN